MDGAGEAVALSAAGSNAMPCSASRTSSIHTLLLLPLQEAIAMNHLTHAHKNGGWVLFQNIHLTIDWTSGPLEKRVDKLADGAHPDFRCCAVGTVSERESG